MGRSVVYHPRDGEREKGRLRHRSLAGPTAGDAPPRQLTNGPHDGGARWSPDGKWLVFARAEEKDGKTQPPQLCLLPLAGGDAFVFTDLPKGAGDPRWSPDGKQLLFTSSSNPEDLAKQAAKKKKTAR